MTFKSEGQGCSSCGAKPYVRSSYMANKGNNGRILFIEKFSVQNFVTAEGALSVGFHYLEIIKTSPNVA